MHHFDLHRERLINFTIDEDSFGLYILREELTVCAEERGRGPSYVIRFMNLALCGCMVYGFGGMWQIKVVHFGYSTYVWTTCKAMVVVLSHPLKRLSAISMLSICGPAWSITNFCLAIREVNLT